MKKYIVFLLAVMGLIITSCGSQIYMDSQSLKTALDNEEFTFMARRANPTNYDVINVMNSLPNSSSGRMLDLSYGYGFTIKDKILEVTLPYFGRLYTPSMDNDKNSFRFTSKDYEIQKTAGKKGSIIFTIIPRDITHIRSMVLEVYKNGGAYLSVGANDRQPISYEGYLMKNEIKK